MATPIFPCLWYDSKAKAAAELYCSVFKNSVIISESPLVVTFDLNGKKIMALNGGPMFTINPSISLYVSCGSVSEVDRIRNILVEGGSELIPIGSYPWSERYSWLRDGFGMTWQIFATGKNDNEINIATAFLFTDEKFGQAEAALNHYRAIFENSATDVLFHYPDGDPNAGNILFSGFRLNESCFVAMDGPGEHAYSFNEAVSLVVECDTQKEIDYYWEKLTEGGEESMCGWLKDKFGVSWQIVPKILADLMTDPEKAQKAIAAFSHMRKFEIEKLLV